MTVVGALALIRALASGISMARAAGSDDITDGQLDTALADNDAKIEDAQSAIDRQRAREAGGA